MGDKTKAYLAYYVNADDDEKIYDDIVYVGVDKDAAIACLRTDVPDEICDSYQACHKNFRDMMYIQTWQDGVLLGDYDDWRIPRSEVFGDAT